MTSSRGISNRISTATPLDRFFYHPVFFDFFCFFSFILFFVFFFDFFFSFLFGFFFLIFVSFLLHWSRWLGGSLAATSANGLLPFREYFIGARRPTSSRRGSREREFVIVIAVRHYREGDPLAPGIGTRRRARGVAPEELSRTPRRRYFTGSEVYWNEGRLH